VGERGPLPHPPSASGPVHRPAMFDTRGPAHLLATQVVDAELLLVTLCAAPAPTQTSVGLIYARSQELNK